MLVDVNTKQKNIQPSTRSIKNILFQECGMHLAISLCIYRPSREIQKGRLFSYIFCPFSPFHWSNFDLELISFALFMSTSSYCPVAPCTYNRWRVELV